MPFINLIQEQRQTVRREERRSRSLLMGLALAVGGVVATYGFIAFESQSLKGEKARLMSELQSVNPIMAKIDEANRSSALFEPKVKTLEDAQLITDRWGRILKHLATQTPVDAWLTTIRCTASDPAKPILLTFSGLAKAQGPVGEFILRLQTCDDLDKVSLHFTNERTVGETKGTEFEIGAELAGSAPDKPKDESGGKS